MTSPAIRPAYSLWPEYNRRFAALVASLSPEQLAFQPAPDRWPLWATIGHVACQRVCWLCDFAGMPGAETTPFTNALYYCPGDEDLDHPMDAEQLVAALDSTFRIVEACLDGWSLEMLAEVIRRAFPQGEWVYSRGAVIQRAFIHDLHHIAELNDALALAGLPQVQLWD